MGKKKIAADNLDGLLEEQTTASEQVTDEPKTAKKAKSNSDYIRLDLKPFGDDLKTYVDNKAIKLSAERGVKVSTTAVIQEIIKADRAAEKGKGKPTKHDKIIAALDAMDDKKLLALATLLDIQII